METKQLLAHNGDGAVTAQIAQLPFAVRTDPHMSEVAECSSSLGL